MCWGTHFYNKTFKMGHVKCFYGLFCVLWFFCANCACFCTLRFVVVPLKYGPVCFVCNILSLNISSFYFHLQHHRLHLQQYRQHCQVCIIVLFLLCFKNNTGVDILPMFLLLKHKTKLK